MPARKAGADRVELVVPAKFEFWDYVRNETSLTQPLECVFSSRIIGVSVVLVPSRSGVLAIIVDGFSRSRHISGLGPKLAPFRRSRANRFVHTSGETTSFVIRIVVCGNI